MKKLVIESTEEGSICSLQVSGSLDEVKEWLAKTLKSLDSFDRGNATIKKDSKALNAVDGEWFTASQLAGLPSLPETSRGIHLRATRENWKRRKIEGLKTNIFHIGNLPQEAQDYIRSGS